MIRVKREMERVGEMEEREEMKAGGPSKPPPPSPTSNHEHGQGMGDKPHKRRRRQYRRRHHHHTFPNALVNVSPPTSTPNPGKHPPPFAPPSNEPRRVRRQRRSRRRHPHCVPANGVMSMSPHASTPALASLGPPIPPPSPGKHPPSRLPRLPAPTQHGGDAPRFRRRRRRHRARSRHRRPHSDPKPLPARCSPPHPHSYQTPRPLHTTLDVPTRLLQAPVDNNDVAPSSCASSSSPNLQAFHLHFVLPCLVPISYLPLYLPHSLFEVNDALRAPFVLEGGGLDPRIQIGGGK